MYTCTSLPLSLSLYLSFKSLIDRRGVMDEAYLAALEEENSNYGATSSVPKVYNIAKSVIGAPPPPSLDFQALSFARTNCSVTFYGGHRSCYNLYVQGREPGNRGYLLPPPSSPLLLFTMHSWHCTPCLPMQLPPEKSPSPAHSDPLVPDPHSESISMTPTASMEGEGTSTYMYMYMGVLCCFALFVCLPLLASFFLPSLISH